MLNINLKISLIILFLALIFKGFGFYGALSSITVADVNVASSIAVDPKIGIKEVDIARLDKLFSQFMSEAGTSENLDNEEKEQLVIPTIKEQSGIQNQIFFADFKLNLISIVRSKTESFAVFEKNFHNDGQQDVINIKHNTAFEGLFLSILSNTQVVFSNDEVSIELNMYAQE